MTIGSDIVIWLSKKRLIRLDIFARSTYKKISKPTKLN
jgi:hypothetical protein